MMDTRDCACGQTTVRDDAARWFVRLQEPAVSADEQQRFDAWLNRTSAAPRRIPVAAGLVDGRRPAAGGAPASPVLKPRRARRERRPLLRYAVAASVVAVALGLGLFSGLNHPGGLHAPSSPRRWASIDMWRCRTVR